MQLQLSAAQLPANPAGTLSLAPQLDDPQTKSRAVGLSESWLQRPTKPLDENEKRGVPYSALND